MAEIRPERGLTPRAFGVGFSLVLVWLFYDCTLASTPALSTIELLYLIGFGAAFTLFGVTAVNQCLPERHRLRPQELTVIYAMMGLMTGMFIFKLLFASMGRGFLRGY